ncbi:hypothetical protein AsFcp4_238 [Aeromonas phage AsFcp_4]|uniref:Uncharacterized protein n=1 Tax=Aeromonas phage PX29 TaxID=926067 RepID=E5DQ15_9CAUD|nr:hypothetical protein CL89_gp082 [Aeromonas phage PX29]ADQ52801.1 conserved hypothetical protein [Aeromonas phage PX29]QAX99690.1 hypothetical protein AsFcp4_238 [Aeromonas phage AsFcp_4]
MKELRVLFLDVDGVYHSDSSYLKYGQMVDIGAVKLLSKLIVDYNLKVVYSSTWRLGCDVQMVRDHLALAGFPPGCLHEDFKTRDLVGEHRGELIKEWLDKHLDCKKYVIIDDDDDMLESQKENFIHVDSANGFTVKDYYRARSVFDGYRTTQCQEHKNMGRI